MLSPLSCRSYLSYTTYPLPYRVGRYRIRYTSRPEYPMGWIPAGRGRNSPYSRMANTRRGILCGGYQRVAVYHTPIYSIHHIISILSILSYISDIIQDREISYRIYLPGGLEMALKRRDTQQAGYHMSGIIRQSYLSYLSSPTEYGGIR